MFGMTAQISFIFKSSIPISFHSKTVNMNYYYTVKDRSKPSLLIKATDAVHKYWIKKTTQNSSNNLHWTFTSDITAL